MPQTSFYQVSVYFQSYLQDLEPFTLCQLSSEVQSLDVRKPYNRDRYALAHRELFATHLPHGMGKRATIKR
jgi:hypothetical protein